MLQNPWSAVGNPTSALGPSGLSFGPSSLAAVGILQARRQEMKWGVFLYRSGKWGVFFCKKWTFLQRRVHYVQYQYILFYILLIWGCIRTQRTPCLRPVIHHLLLSNLTTGTYCSISVPNPNTKRWKRR